ncbi:MAG: hypothetical protein ACT4OM_07460 [Actinomycetota bacterium]
MRRNRGPRLPAKRHHDHHGDHTSSAAHRIARSHHHDHHLMDDSLPNLDYQTPARPSAESERSSGIITLIASKIHPLARKMALLALGLAPFLLFVALLPPGETLQQAQSVALPAAVGGSVPLNFPFPDEDAFSSANPSPGPSAPLLVGASPDPGRNQQSSPAPSAVREPAPAPTLAPAPTPEDRLSFEAPPPACSNGIDDDGEGGIDMADPGCSSPNDWSEADNPPCSNGLDDDGDGLVDGRDPNCAAGESSEAGRDPLGNGQDNPPDPLDEQFDLFLP